MLGSGSERLPAEPSLLLTAQVWMPCGRLATFSEAMVGCAASGSLPNADMTRLALVTPSHEFCNFSSWCWYQNHLKVSPTL
jgi:hypothetical protein